MERFYIVDGHHLFYRAYYGRFAQLSHNGEPTKATYQFTREIISLVENNSPSYCAIVFDGDRGDLIRRKIYPGYKDRHDQPADVQPQLRRITQIMSMMGVCVFSCKGYEADDAIATLASQCASKEVEAVIISRDKDLMSLIRPGVRMYSPVDHRWITRLFVKRRYGVMPDQIPDYLALMGDKVDNVPGVEGFGEKLAARFLSVYRNIDGLIQAASTGGLPARLAASLLQAQASGSLKLSQDLIRLDNSVELPITSQDLECNGLNLKKVRPLFRKLGFRSLL